MNPTGKASQRELCRSSNHHNQPQLPPPRIPMWGKRRPTIICLPKASAVCGGVRSRVASPLAQGRSVTTREQNEFLLWLRRRGEHEACSAVTIGMSVHGRGLFASRPIRTGERILRISRKLIITPDKLHPEAKNLLPKDVSSCARLALVVLAEQHAVQVSEWAPYINCLPRFGALHNTVLWSDEELEMLRSSAGVHRQTLQFRASILDEFAAVQHVLQQCPHIFGHNVSCESFRHAYAIVNSRAWGVDAQSTVGLVPFVDFFNHDANCQSFLSFDNEYEFAEVIADRNYAMGEQVLINYGKFGNDVLAITFGFTLSYNPYDQVEVWMGLSQRDTLRKEKLNLLHAHGMPTLAGLDNHDGGGNAFFIKEVKIARGRGKGIPQSLRAFARILCTDSAKDLAELAKEASEYDGRLARRPLKNKRRELQAMVLLLARVQGLIQDHVSALVALQMEVYCQISQKHVISARKEMVESVLVGELRVLRSAANWLKQHCTALNSLF